FRVGDFYLFQKAVFSSSLKKQKTASGSHNDSRMLPVHIKIYCGTRAVQRDKSAPSAVTNSLGKINVQGFVVLGCTVNTGSNLNDPLATRTLRASIISIGNCSKLIALSCPLRIKIDAWKLPSSFNF